MPEKSVKDRLQAINPGTEEFEEEGRRMVLYKNESEISNLALAAVQDYTALSDEAGSMNRVIIAVSLVMILVASVIIYLFSLYVYEPLKKLGHKMADIPRARLETRNEYRLIEHAVEELQNENRYGLPAVVRDSVGKLMTEPFDEERFEYLKLVLGQRMAGEWNILVAAESAREGGVFLAEAAFRRLIDSDPQIDGLAASVSSTWFTGIFSTDLEYRRFVAKVESIKEELEHKNEKILCCISRCFKKRENIRLIYQETVRSIEEAAFRGRETLIYDMADTDAEQDVHFGKEESRLTQCVMAGNSSEAERILGNIMEEMENHTSDILFIRFLCFRLCSSLIRNIKDLGGKLTDKYGSITFLVGLALARYRPSQSSASLDRNLRQCSMG